MERGVVAEEVEGFRADDLTIPALSIFALEEPENHLSPYYLARIVRQVRSLVKEGGAQAILTSHSPAVLSRVKADEVRYCRCDPKSRLTSVKAVKLPIGDAEAVKFVRGAMLAFPELYFARFVLLVEGDSERIVLPLLAEALGLVSRSRIRRHRATGWTTCATFLASADRSRNSLCNTCSISTSVAMVAVTAA